MASKYEKGQKVIVTPVKNQQLSPRDSDIGVYEGECGKVTDYYWVSTGQSAVFYIYTVRMETDHKDIIVHEDEIQAHLE